jgi:phosphate transport system permease protein
MKFAKTEERIFRVLMTASMAVVLMSLIMIIGVVAVKGFGAVSLEMITSTPQGGYYLGKGGGVLNAIYGSLVITGIATVIAFIMSFPVAMYMNV